MAAFRLQMQTPERFLFHLHLTIKSGDVNKNTSQGLSVSSTEQEYTGGL